MSELSCSTCKYDAEMDGQSICTLRRHLVMEFAKEYFPADFEILNNWFMDLEPCDYWVTKEGVSKAYGAVEKEALEKLGEICVDFHERTPRYNQFCSILTAFMGLSEITPWVTEASPFATNTSSIMCLPLSQYKKLRILQHELKNFLDHAKLGFDEKIYGPMELEQEKEASGMISVANPRGAS